MKKVEISVHSPRVLIAAYGTLRPSGGGNYEWYLKDKSEHLGTYKTNPEFVLYGKNWGFPIVSTGGNTAIEYDLFEVTDPYTLENIHALEGCTGVPGDENNWYDLKRIQNDEHGECWMYVQHEKFEQEAIIETGSWINQE